MPQLDTLLKEKIRNLAPRERQFDASPLNGGLRGPHAVGMGGDPRTLLWLLKSGNPPTQLAPPEPFLIKCQMRDRLHPLTQAQHTPDCLSLRL